MSAFLSRLRVEILPPSEVTGQNLYRLTEPFIVDSNIVGRIEIETGFVTNFASVPWIAYRYIHPEKPCICYPSVPHDWGYSRGGVMPDGRKFTRSQWDDVLEELMEIAGARWDERKVVRRAVGLCGGSHWTPVSLPKAA